MQIRLKHAHWGALAAILICAAPAAQAFTLGGEAANGSSSNYDVPKFDLEEQSRQFSSGKPDLGLTPGDKKGVETPYGTFQFGVQRNNSLFAPGFMGSGISDANREHFVRHACTGSRLVRHRSRAVSRHCDRRILSHLVREGLSQPLVERTRSVTELASRLRIRPEIRDARQHP